MRRILSCLLVICLLLGSVTFGTADEEAASTEIPDEVVSVIEDAETAPDTDSETAEADEPEPADTEEASTEDEEAESAQPEAAEETAEEALSQPQPEASDEAVPDVQAVFDKGYAGVSRGAQAYKAADSAEKAGSFPAKDSVVYAELAITGDSADTSCGAALLCHCQDISESRVSSGAAADSSSAYSVYPETFPGSVIPRSSLAD